LIESAVPVADARAVKSKVLDLIGQLVEPGIEGVQAESVSESRSSKSGFVVVLVPKSDDPPRRSRKDWKFYQRIGSGTFPMEYFQIEERFGKRPAPQLELYLERVGIKNVTHEPRLPRRVYVLGLKNVGRGLAKFPSIRYRRDSQLIVDFFGIDGNHGFGLPQRPAQNEWVVFRGGVDDVIYPGEIREITKIGQHGKNTDAEFRPPEAILKRPGRTNYVFAATKLEYEITCEGMATASGSTSLGEEDCLWP